MARASIAELTATAAAAEEPFFAPAAMPKLGGVDPLGMRQINFDLMDEVLPGLNNVARHIRPFVVVTWAWRRAHQLARERGNTHVKQDELLDFVDRVEVLYVASQLLRNPDADLPGKDYLKSLLSGRTFCFDGPEWHKRRTDRRYSTALSAPINYGPGLKALSWAVPHPEHRGIMLPTTAVQPALDALEDKLSSFIDDDGLSKLGPVIVSRDKVGSWADAWSLEAVSKREREVMTALLFGPMAPAGRQLGGELLLLAAQHVGSHDVSLIRAAMTGHPATFNPPQDLIAVRDAWRCVQTRQLFRLALEAMLYWTMFRLEGGPRSIESLVAMFLKEASLPRGAATANSWLASLSPIGLGPTEMIDAIQDALADPEGGDLAHSIMAGIALSLAEPPGDAAKTESIDRLPLSRAQLEAKVRPDSSPAEFLRHVLESWVLAQHAYWCIGRGLADARAGGKILLRMKVILDEDGWTLTPGTTISNPPEPTRDRLHTAISLATECGLL